MNIVIACDKDSIKYLEPLFKSIYDNCNNPIIYLITDKDPVSELIEKYKINIIEFSLDVADPYQRITKHTYYRLYIDKLLPKKIKTCLYIDFDTLVVGNIEQLLVFDDNNVDINVAIMPGDGDFFNAGVIGFNLTKSCKEKLEKCRSLITCPDYVNDQVILNEVFKDSKHNVGAKYNVMIGRLDAVYDDARIIHYLGSGKPWKLHESYKYYFKYK